MIPKEEFPRLTPSNHRITSPETPDYNCIAWSVGDAEHWWQPGIYWPTSASPDDFGIGALEQAYLALGFEDCADETVEPGFEKVALYGSHSFYTHAARQLPNGRWSSKLGRGVDIEHETPHDISEGIYGQLMQFIEASPPAAAFRSGVIRNDRSSPWPVSWPEDPARRQPRVYELAPTSASSRHERPARGVPRVPHTCYNPTH